MTQATSLEPLVGSRPAVRVVRPTRLRAVAFVAAVVSCLPYLALKVSWIAGAELGIPESSPLLDPANVPTMRAVNALTVLMDSAVIGLALVLTRPWGRRVPAWLLAGPVWLATGLLGPIVVGFPAQVVASLVTGPSTAARDADVFLDPWVFTVVYTGFVLQALALGVLFIGYAGERWAYMWRGRIAGLPSTTTQPALRLTAAMTIVLASFPLTFQVLWSSGSVRGLNAGRAEQHGLDELLAQATHVPFTLAAVVGAVMLAFRLGGRLRLPLPLALTWVGSAAMTGWGAWFLFGGLLDSPVQDQPTPTMTVVHGLQLTVGLMVAVAGAHFLAERSEA
jgi:hypothetical protein